MTQVKLDAIQNAAAALMVLTALSANAQEKPQTNVPASKVVGDILSKPAAVKSVLDSASNKQKIEPVEENSTAAKAESPALENKNMPATAPRVGSSPKRDPFRPYTVTSRNGSARRRENLSPLERYELGQLKLVAVIWNAKEPSAMVEDASGLGYLVKIGTAIGPNDGKVTAIRRDGIVIEENLTDLYGVTKKQESSMRLNAESAG